MFYLEKSCICTAFQDGLPLKIKPQRPPTASDFINPQSPRCFMAVWGLVLKFSFS